jgi:hypothetical protein
MTGVQISALIDLYSIMMMMMMMMMTSLGVEFIHNIEKDAETELKVNLR